MIRNRELYCKRLTISYEGEGSLTPLIKLDGEIIAKGDLTVFGNEDILEIEVNSGNEAHLIHNKIKAGGIYQITCDAQTITPRELDGSLENFREAQQTISEFNVLEEDKVGSMLDLAGKLYFAMLDVQNRVTASQCEVNTSRTLSVGMMGYCPVGVDENGGGFLFTDIDYDSYNVAESGENAKLFMLMSGMTSSAYESEIWELFTGIPSVSTMSVFEAAYEGEIEGVVLTKHNFEEKRSSLKVADSVIANIEKEVQADKLVILPNETIHMLDWQGSAYIALDCETMAGGYIIDGGFHNVSLNGGSSSVTWTKESIANMILLAVDVYEIVTMVSAATALLAMGPVGTIFFAGVLIFAVAMLAASFLFYANNLDLINQYYAGDEAAGEELYNGLMGAAGLNLGFTAFGGVVQGSVIKFAKSKLAKEAGEVLAGKLVARFDDAGDAYKVYKNLKNANVGSPAIEELVDCLEKESLRKLSTLAARQLPGNILEAFGRNGDVLDNLSISDALAFKNAVSSGEDIVRLYRKHGSGFVTAFKCYGDDAVEILLTHGDNALDDLMEYGLDFIGLHRIQGENFARLYAKYGRALLDQYRIYPGSLFTNVARFGDDYVEYVIRYGNNFVKGADKYHDYFLIGIRTYDDLFMNMYREEGDEFVERFIKDGCEIVEGGSMSRVFREATQHDIDLIDNIKIKYNAGTTRNAACAKGTIGGDSIDLESISGKFTHENYYNKGNFEPPQPENYHYIGPIPEYTNHTEQKIVEYLRVLYKDNPSVSGEIEIISERIFCDNCAAVVDMFEGELPNIVVTRVEVLK